MSGNVFPDSHTTSTTQGTTVTTTTTASPDQRLFLNVGFFKSEHGILKFAQVTVCMVAFICAMSAGSPYTLLSGVNFISFVTVSGMLISAILLFIYFINAVVYFPSIPWVLTELIYCAIWTFFSCIGGIVGSTLSSKYMKRAPFGASSFFLFVAMCIYGFSSFRLFMLHRKGVRLVLAVTEVTTFTHTVVPPA